MKSQSAKLSYSESWELPHAPEKVWRALTESDLLSKWILPNDMKATVGNKFTFKAKPTEWWDGVVYCEVLEIKAPELLKYAWQGGKNQSGGFGVDTVVTWRLKKIPNGTLLSLEQAGFDPEYPQAFGGAKVGWKRYIENLNQILGQG